jgi:hypothetical protein
MTIEWLVAFISIFGKRSRIDGSLRLDRTCPAVVDAIACQLNIVEQQMMNKNCTVAIHSITICSNLKSNVCRQKEEEVEERKTDRRNGVFHHRTFKVGGCKKKTNIHEVKRK